MAGIHSAGLKDQIFPIHPRQRQDLILFIHGHCHHNAVGSRRPPGQFKSILPACGFQHTVRSSAPGKFFDLLFHITVSGIQDHIRDPLFFCKVQPEIIPVYRNDPGRAVQSAGHHSAKSRRAGSQHRNRILPADFSQLGGPVSGRQQIPGKQRLFVGYALRDLVQSLISMGDPHIFRLSAVNPASQHPSAFRVRTIVHIPPPAKETVPAEGFHIDRRPVSFFYLFYSLSGLFHHTYKLMAQDHPRLCHWHSAMKDMYVAAADGCHRHPYNNIRIFLDLWPGALLQLWPPLLCIDYPAHRFVSSFFWLKLYHITKARSTYFSIASTPNRLLCFYSFQDSSSRSRNFRTSFA